MSEPGGSGRWAREHDDVPLVSHFRQAGGHVRLVEWPDGMVIVDVQPRLSIAKSRAVHERARRGR